MGRGRCEERQIRLRGRPEAESASRRETTSKAGQTRSASSLQLVEETLTQRRRERGKADERLERVDTGSNKMGSQLRLRRIDAGEERLDKGDSVYERYACSGVGQESRPTELRRRKR